MARIIYEVWVTLPSGTERRTGVAEDKQQAEEYAAADRLNDSYSSVRIRRVKVHSRKVVRLRSAVIGAADDLRVSAKYRDGQAVVDSLALGRLNVALAMLANVEWKGV